MSLTDAGRTYGGAGGSQEKNENCIYKYKFLVLCKFCICIITTDYLGGIEMMF